MWQEISRKFILCHDQKRILTTFHDDIKGLQGNKFAVAIDEAHL